MELELSVYCGNNEEIAEMVSDLKDTCLLGNAKVFGLKGEDLQTSLHDIELMVIVSLNEQDLQRIV